MYKTLLEIKAASDKCRDGLFTPYWAVQTNLLYFEHSGFSRCLLNRDEVLDSDWTDLTPLDFRGFINDANRWFELIRVGIFPASLVAHMELWRSSDYWDNTSCAGPQSLFWGSPGTCKVFLLLWHVKTYPSSLHLQDDFFFNTTQHQTIGMNLFAFMGKKNLQSSFNISFFIHTGVMS